MLFSLMPKYSNVEDTVELVREQLGSREELMIKCGAILYGSNGPH